MTQPSEMLVRKPIMELLMVDFLMKQPSPIVDLETWTSSSLLGGKKRDWV
jgi:hypothetical protein